MYYSAKLLFLAAVFLLSGSQAVISNDYAPIMNTAGYYCSKGNQTSQVHIHYGGQPQGLPCQVNYQGPNGPLVQLLEATRFADRCLEKAESMAVRLLDRGWHCQSINSL